VTAWICAEPVYGYLTHAVTGAFAYPDSREEQPLSYRGQLILGRTACGIRGRDAWGGGGLRATVTAEGDTVPFTATQPKPSEGWDKRQYNKFCPKCIAILKRERSAA